MLWPVLWDSDAIMTDTPPTVEQVPPDLIDYAKSEFSLHATDFAHLDNKAIGIMGVIGILIGFQALNLDNLVSLLKTYNASPTNFVACLGILIVVLYAILLIVSFIYVLLAFQIRDLDYPTETLTLVDRLKGYSKENSEQMKVDIVKSYADSTKNIEKANGAKAKKIKFAIWSIIFAVLLMILSYTLIVIHKASVT